MFRKLITQQGVLIVALGVVMVLGGISLSSGCAADLSKVFYQFIETIGITLFAFGMFSIITDSKNWRKYFEERLREIVVDNDYLNDLHIDKLKALQIDLMKAIFKNPNIDKEKSFLNYFNQNLHGYIAEPYREDVSTEVIMQGEEDGCFKIFDRISYVCRKSGDSIQKYIWWKPVKGEFRRVNRVNVCVKYPESHANKGQEKVLYDESTSLQSKDEHDIQVSLLDYKDVDGLIVTITSEYLLDKNRFQSWQMAFPTRNLDITIKYDEKYSIQYLQLVLKPELTQVTDLPGYLKIKYDSWMLPMSGLAWKFSENLPAA